MNVHYLIIYYLINLNSRKNMPPTPTIMIMIIIILIKRLVLYISFNLLIINPLLTQILGLV